MLKDPDSFSDHHCSAIFAVHRQMYKDRYENFKRNVTIIIMAVSLISIISPNQRCVEGEGQWAWYHLYFIVYTSFKYEMI